MNFPKHLTFVFAIIILCFCQISLADDNWVESPPTGWIRSFPSEDKIPSSSDYPTAGAVYLLNEDILYVADKQEVKVVIMKIFDRRGHGYAEVSSPFYHRGEKVEVRGRTKKKDGTIVELKPEDIHEIMVSKKLKRKRFTLPGVEDGCLIHYEIMRSSRRYNLSGIRYFQEEEPVLLSRFNLIAPKNLQVIYYDSPPGLLDTAKKIPLHSEQNVLYTFVKRDLLAEETEAHMPPLFQYSPSVAFTITIPETEDELNSSWENISGWYHETLKKHFAPNGEIKKLAKRLTRELSDEKEKAEKIFYFIQSHFKVEFPSRSIFDPAHTIFNNQVGSSAEVTGMLYAMLNAVEIQSTPVLVPDKRMVIDVPDVPMLDWFTHLMLKVDVEGEEIWLDPGKGGNPLNCISESHQGVDGLLVGESDGRLIRTPQTGYRENLRSCVIEIDLQADGSIHCRSKEIYSPSRSSGMRELLLKQTIPERKNHLAKKIHQFCPGAVLDTFWLDGLNDYDVDLAIHLRLRSSHCIQKMDSVLYFNPNILNQDLTAKDFAEPTRIFPIMFEQVKTDVDSIVIKLPAWYDVVYLPNPVNLNNEFGEFSTQFKTQNNQIIYKRKMIIKKLMLSQDTYKDVKDFFNRIFLEDQKLIILRKKG
jgi:hypothetical protein